MAGPPPTPRIEVEAVPGRKAEEVESRRALAVPGREEAVPGRDEAVPGLWRWEALVIEVRSIA